MINFLARLIIKNYDEYKNEKVRTGYGVLCSIVGIGLNLVLFGFKFLAGFLSNSIAVTADAFNNLSDAGSSLITMVGFKVANKKSDPDHPFGHGRIEYISGLLVSIIILIMAYELLKDSVMKIFNPQPVESSAVVLIILVLSILVKVYMFLYNTKYGKLIDSTAMRATGKDSLSDSVATVVVLLCTLINYFSSLNLDGYFGILVSLFVAYAGIGALKDTIGPLLGQAPDPEFVQSVENIVMSYQDKGILGTHDLIVHDYGPGRVFLSVHVEIPSNRDILEMHDIIDLIEKELQTKLSCGAVIHMDPVCVDDPETEHLKAIVSEAVSELNARNSDGTVTFHDFRLVKGPSHTNLIFDVVIPFKYPMEDSQVIDFLKQYVNEKNNKYFCAINVDKSYT